MKYKIPIFCILTTVVCILNVTAAVDKVTLSIRKNVVVSVSDRASVISAADAYMGEKDSAILATIDQVPNPFFGKVEPVEAEITNTQTADGTKVVSNQTTIKQSAEVIEVPKEVIYGDESVLKVIAANFARQVRGTLARGSNNYIQLQGGNLIEAGASFPAHLPQDADKTYTVKLIEVTSDDYTLSLGASTLTIPYSEPSTSVRRDP
ncbi:MAG: hypothetical protein ACSHX8_00480 [Opitutaceae bacterium]